MVTFQPNTLSTVKKLEISISFESNYRKQRLLFIVFKMVETTFSNYREGFSLVFPKLQRLRMKLHTYKYDSTSGTKISICFIKNWGDEAVDRNKHL